MQKFFPKTQLSNPLVVLRRAAYSPFVDPQTREHSFVARLTAAFYPRFHLYLEDQGDKWSFNLHLDQKQASYEGSNKHAGEYEGPAVEKEMARIESWVKAVARESQHPVPKDQEPEHPGPKKSRWVDWFFS